MYEARLEVTANDDARHGTPGGCCSPATAGSVGLGHKLLLNPTERRMGRDEGCGGSWLWCSGLMGWMGRGGRAEEWRLREIKEKLEAGRLGMDP